MTCTGQPDEFRYSKRVKTLDERTSKKKTTSWKKKLSL